MFESDRDELPGVPDGMTVKRLPTENGGYVTTTRGYTVGVFNHRGVTYTVTSADLDERAIVGLIDDMR